MYLTNNAPSYFVPSQHQFYRPSGDLGHVISLINKNECGVIRRHLRGKVAVSVGEVDKPFKVVKFLDLDQRIHITEHGTEIRAAESVELHIFQIAVELCLRSYFNVLLNRRVTLDYV